jgi:hypothetical protein
MISKCDVTENKQAPETFTEEVTAGNKALTLLNETKWLSSFQQKILNKTLMNAIKTKT